MYKRMASKGGRGMKNLKAIRTSKGISQAELGRRTGICRQNICEYEKGRSSGTVDTALKIAKALNVSLDELCGEKITIQAPKTNIEKIKTYNIKDMTEFLNRNMFCPFRTCIQRNESGAQYSCKDCIGRWLQSEIK